MKVRFEDLSIPLKFLVVISWIGIGFACLNWIGTILYAFAG